MRRVNNIKEESLKRTEKDTSKHVIPHLMRNLLQTKGLRVKPAMTGGWGGLLRSARNDGWGGLPRFASLRGRHDRSNPEKMDCRSVRASRLAMTETVLNHDFYKIKKITTINLINRMKITVLTNTKEYKLKNN